MTQQPPNPVSTNNPTSLSLGQKLLSQRLFSWALFSVLLTLIPICAPGFAGLVNKKSHVGFKDLVKHGEVLLLCAPIVLSGLVELIKVKQTTKSTLFTLFAAGGIVFLSAILYTNVSTTPAENLDVDSVWLLSVLFFVFSAVIGASCIVLSDEGVTP